MRTLRRLYHLPRDEVAELVRAMLAFTIVEACVRTFRIEKAASLLRVPLSIDANRATDQEPFTPAPDIIRVVRAVHRVSARWPFGDTCLRRALATGWLVRHKAPTLRLGIRRTVRGIRGHAWLELSGCPLDPDVIDTTIPLRRVRA